MTLHMVILVLVSIGVTFGLRALPFIAFHGDRKMPPWLDNLGGMLPSAILAVLIVYCLKDAYTDYQTYLIPKAIAVVYVVLTYKWKHSLLLSIVGGTALYMVLLHVI